MQRPLISRLARTTRSGFTLIELVVVVAVLVILAGLILPNLGVFKLKANKGVAASNMHGVTRFVESYRVQKDLFPDKFDSLLDTTGSPYAFLDPQLIAGAAGPGGNPPGVPGSPHKLVTTTITTNDQLRSLTRMGITTVMDQDGASAPNFSGTLPRGLALNSVVATLNNTGAGADDDAKAIADDFYPQNLLPGGTPGSVPTGKTVVLFGVGPQCTLIGEGLHTAPFYANTDQNTYYSRFLVAFEMEDDGSRATFLGTLGGDGDPMRDEIAEYYQL